MTEIVRNDDSQMLAVELLFVIISSLNRLFLPLILVILTKIVLPCNYVFSWSGDKIVILNGISFETQTFIFKEVFFYPNMNGEIDCSLSFVWVIVAFLLC